MYIHNFVLSLGEMSRDPLTFDSDTEGRHCRQSARKQKQDTMTGLHVESSSQACNKYTSIPSTSYDLLHDIRHTLYPCYSTRTARATASLKLPLTNTSLQVADNIYIINKNIHENYELQIL
jgi:hypothetical protein